MMKKTIALLLSVILIVSAFTACSKGDNADNKTDVDEQQVNFTIDSHYANIDESAVRAYEKICNAVINCEKEVKLNANLLDDVYNLFYTSFPLFSLVESIQIFPDSSGVELVYKNSEEEHKNLVSQFFDRIDEIMLQCQYATVNTDEYIFNVYTYITTNFTLNSSVITLPDVVMNNEGYSAVLCSLFEYLVLQGGGEASHIINVEASSMISLVKFKGEWYYFNPALDIENNQGRALTGFAMNSERTGNIEYNFTDYTPASLVSDATFDKLKNSLSFELSDERVNVNCSNNDNFILEFK